MARGGRMVWTGFLGGKLRVRRWGQTVLLSAYLNLCSVFIRVSYCSVFGMGFLVYTVISNTYTKSMRYIFLATHIYTQEQKGV